MCVCVCVRERERERERVRERERERETVREREKGVRVCEVRRKRADSISAQPSISTLTNSMFFHESDEVSLLQQWRGRGHSLAHL